MSEDKEKNIVFQSNNAKQLQFIEAVFSGKHTVLTFGGAIRGGKTFVALAIAVMLCKIYPKSRWTVVRQSLKRLKDNTRPSIDKLLPENVKINEQNQTFTFPNGSVIIFKGENYDRDKTLESFKGHETNGFIAEEVSEIRKQTFEKMKERAGTYMIKPVPKNGQPPPLIIMTCNPTQSWIKQLVYDPWKKGELPNYMYYLPSYITDNKENLSEAYIENIKTLSQYEYEVFVLGNWDIALKTKNAFFHAFDINKHVKKLYFDRTLPIHISIDSNSLPYCSCTIWQFDLDKKEARQIAEVKGEGDNSHAGGLAKVLTEHLLMIDYDDILHCHGDQTTKAQNTIDPLKRSFFDIFFEEMKNNFNCVDKLQSKNPTVSKTGEFVNALLENYDGWSVYYDETCKDSINDYLLSKKDTNGAMQKKRVTNEEGESFEELGHWCDTKRYVLYVALNSVYLDWDNRFSEPTEYEEIEIFDNTFDE